MYKFIKRIFTDGFIVGICYRPKNKFLNNVKWPEGMFKEANEQATTITWKQRVPKKFHRCKYCGRFIKDECEDCPYSNHG
jgi:hypothetical protein